MKLTEWHVAPTDETGKKWFVYAEGDAEAICKIEDVLLDIDEQNRVDTRTAEIIDFEKMKREKGL